MDARSLGCPNCGAPASLDSVQCGYCKAALQTVACPSCFGLIFFGSKFCPRCGARAASPLPKHVDASCPRCRRVMTAHSLGGCVLDQCGSCGGIWLDNATFKDICADRDKQAAFVAPGSESDVKSHDPTEKALVYLPCPRCEEFMNRVNFAGISGILLNVCAKDGTWFDKDELQQVVEFVRAGGLDLARRDQLDRLTREKNRVEEKLATAQQTNALAVDLALHHDHAAAGLLLRLLTG